MIRVQGISYVWTVGSSSLFFGILKQFTNIQKPNFHFKTTKNTMSLQDSLSLWKGGIRKRLLSPKRIAFSSVIHPLKNHYSYGKTVCLAKQRMINNSSYEALTPLHILFQPTTVVIYSILGDFGFQQSAFYALT